MSECVFSNSDFILGANLLNSPKFEFSLFLMAIIAKVFRITQKFLRILSKRSNFGQDVFNSDRETG